MTRRARFIIPIILIIGLLLSCIKPVLAITTFKYSDCNNADYNNNYYNHIGDAIGYDTSGNWYAPGNPERAGFVNSWSYFDSYVYANWELNSTGGAYQPITVDMHVQQWIFVNRTWSAIPGNTPMNGSFVIVVSNSSGPPYTNIKYAFFITVREMGGQLWVINGDSTLVYTTSYENITTISYEEWTQIDVWYKHDEGKILVEVDGVQYGAWRTTAVIAEHPTLFWLGDFVGLTYSYGGNGMFYFDAWHVDDEAPPALASNVIVNAYDLATNSSLTEYVYGNETLYSTPATIPGFSGDTVTLEFQQTLGLNNTHYAQFVNWSDGTTGNYNATFTDSTVYVSAYFEILAYPDYSATLILGMGIFGWLLIGMSWIIGYHFYKEGNYDLMFASWFTLFIFGFGLIHILFGG